MRVKGDKLLPKLASSDVGALSVSTTLSLLLTIGLFQLLNAMLGADGRALSTTTTPGGTYIVSVVPPGTTPETTLLS